MIPIALLCHNKTEDNIFELVSMECIISHPNMKCIDAAIVYTNMLIDCINKDITKDNLFKNALNRCCEETINIIINSKKTYIYKYKDIEIDPTIALLTTEYYTSLQLALYCFYNFNSFPEIIREIVKFGGDCGTNSALAGALAGSYYGYKKINELWVEKLIMNKDKKEKSI